MSCARGHLAVVFGAVPFGTTGAGGQYGWGTAFELTPSSGGGWSESVLYTFTGGSDGGNPFAPLVYDSAGNFYGTTYTGSNTTECGWAVPFDGCGVVYKLAPPTVQGGAWSQSVLYAFTSTGVDANLPGEAGVIFGQGGLLYGTTIYGGSGGCKSYLGNVVGCGAVYSVTQ